MANGETLANLRASFKAECDLEMDESVSSADNVRINQRLANTQKWLATKYGLFFLKARATINLVAGSQYYDFPIASLSFENLRGEQTVLQQGQRYKVHFRITQENYQYSDPFQGQRLDPAQRWDVVNVGGVQKVEIWPLPGAAGQLILEGQRPLQPLVADDDVCDLDDLLIVYFAAAKWLAKEKGADASAMLAQAQSRLAELRAGYPSVGDKVQVLGGGDPWARPSDRGRVRRPTIAVSN